MDSLPPYRARIEPDWIDYNGHLRDAYYGLVLSYAIDDMMDHLGIDAAYRERTKCTLFTLELHVHYLQGIDAADILDVTASILDFDRKRIHVGCRFACPRIEGYAATGEVMLLHVHQGERPASAAFPADIEATLDTLKLSAERRAQWGPGSRRMELTRRPAP